MNIRLSGNERKALAERIKADINAACVARFTDKPRAHMGASEIGEKCERRLAYAFRWMAAEVFDGRMLRLFDRGHKEEVRIIEWLRMIGAQASEVDEATGKQYRVAGGNHFGGSLDGKMTLPERYALPFEFLLEFKTHSQKSFDRLVKLGVRMAKPKHFDQMCLYGAAYNLSYAVYIAVNKNDDDLHIEVVEINTQRARELWAKAQRIISSPVLPPRISGSAAYQDCQYCPMKNVCHLGEPAAKNCRSCAHSVPAEDQTWHCSLFSNTIPAEFIPQGCGHWRQFA